MGVVRLGSSSRYDSSTTFDGTCTINTFSKSKLPNPDPSRYEILDSYEKGGYLLVKIKYLDCTNYEGNKILLYIGTTLKKLKKQKLIDPHFSENTKYKSPIARFEPTAIGWFMGKALINDLIV